MPADPQFETSRQPARQAAGRKRGLLRLAALVSAVALVAGVSLLLTTRSSPRSARHSAHRHAAAKPARHGDPVPVPILMYHHVAPARSGPALLWVRRRQFAEELAYLHAHGYHPVTLEAVYDCWT